MTITLQDIERFKIATQAYSLACKEFRRINLWYRRLAKPTTTAERLVWFESKENHKIASRTYYEERELFMSKRDFPRTQSPKVEKPFGPQGVQEIKDVLDHLSDITDSAREELRRSEGLRQALDNPQLKAIYDTARKQLQEKKKEEDKRYWINGLEVTKTEYEAITRSPMPGEIEEIDAFKGLEDEINDRMPEASREEEPL